MTFKTLLQSKTQLKLTEYHREFLEHGKARAVFKAHDLHLGHASTVEAILNLHLVLIEMQLQKNKTFVTVESLPQSNKMTFKDKQSSLDHFTLNILLLRMLVQESITHGKGCIPFWNRQCKETSEKLWLPTKTDLLVSGLNSSNPLLKKEVEKSPSLITSHSNPEKKNFQMTSLPSSMYSAAEKWVKGDTVVKNHKLKIYPTPQQRKVLRSWFGTYRYVYNRALDFSNQKYHPTITLDQLFNQYNDDTNFFRMRNMFVTKKSGIEMFPPGQDTPILNTWEFETPKDIRAGAIKEFTTALKTNKKNVVQGKTAFFKMRFKSKKRKTSESITVPKTSIKFKNGKVTIFSRFLKGKIRLGTKKEKRYKHDVQMDSRLTFDGHDFYLLLPKKITVKEKRDDKKVVALDPGVRTFQTGYSESEIFKGDILRPKFEKLKNKISTLQSLRDKQTNTKTNSNKYKRRLRKLNLRIKNMVNECHWQVAHHLLKHYNDVLLPSFESQDMVKKGTLQKKSKNNLLSLSHYKFKVRLQEKAKEYKNFRIHNVNEAYTSQTCTSCGYIHSHLGGDKTFKCPSCASVLDRDVNGARNIFLKYVSK